MNLHRTNTTCVHVYMCTSNKMVNGEQVKLKFHVDDLKVLHKTQAVLNNFLDKLRSEFG